MWLSQSVRAGPRVTTGLPSNQTSTAPIAGSVDHRAHIPIWCQTFGVTAPGAVQCTRSAGMRVTKAIVSPRTSKLMICL